MMRLVVPVMLCVLLAAQLLNLLPAYRWSKIRLVEAVYEKPRMHAFRSSTRMLGGAAEMARILHEVAKRRGATEADSKPNFEETEWMLVARFSLIDGDARAVSADFGQVIALAAWRAVQQATAADRNERGSKSSTEPTTPAAFRLARLDESRRPWLQPVDLLAAAVNVIALIVWFRRRRAGEREPQG